MGIQKRGAQCLFEEEDGSLNTKNKEYLDNQNRKTADTLCEWELRMGAEGGRPTERPRGPPHWCSSVRWEVK